MCTVKLLARERCFTHRAHSRGGAVLLASIMFLCGSGTALSAPAGTADPAVTAETSGEADTAVNPESTRKAETSSRPDPTSAAKAALKTVVENTDKTHEWLGRKFASLIDATDKAFGDERVEDQEQIVRAKIGLKGSYIRTEGTHWSIPSNFRIPLPALQRKANVFLDLSTDSESGSLTSYNLMTSDQNTSLSAAILKKITENINAILTFDVYGGWDIGPKVKLRYEHAWDPWNLFAEQQFFWRTKDHWGGKTSITVDYALPDGASYLRWVNRTNYYQALHRVGLESAFMYRRHFYFDTALSLEMGVNYNPYNGDPEKKHVLAPGTASTAGPNGTDAGIDPGPDPGTDDDNVYAKVRVIGKGWREWIEWEIVPGYYYKWEQPDAWRWGVEFRLSVLYEAYLRPNHER